MYSKARLSLDFDIPISAPRFDLPTLNDRLEILREQSTLFLKQRAHDKAFLEEEILREYAKKFSGLVYEDYSR